jgi:D-alanyl-D-alanine carboxypeptidase/D-alanyl-D-alanine-endopeptidase (penicillin-binding protein 4)
MGAVRPLNPHRRLGTWLLVAALLGGGAAPGPAQGAAGVAAEPGKALGARIRAFLQAPRFAAARWGIQVLDLDTGRVLFDQDAGKYFLPASDTKLFTAAMALQELGPDLRIRTSLYASARPGGDGALAGDLVLYGRGDPSLMAPWRGGPYRPDPMERLAEQLQAQGVRSIRGDLVGDDSCFTAPPYGPGADWADLRFPYGAEPTALAVHHNWVDLWVYPGPAPGTPCFLFAQPGHGLVALRNDTRTAAPGAGQGVRADRAPGEAAVRVTGSLAAGAGPVRLAVTIRDSALFAARLLERALARHGIRLEGRVRSRHAQDRGTPLRPDQMVELGHLESPPLGTILKDMLKDSDNLSAQLVLLQAGARAGAAVAGDTARRGLAVLDAWMARAGLRPGDAVLEEGAGLSRRNLVQPRAIVQLLAYMDRQPAGAAFRAALPLAGVDGTLRERLGGTAAAGILNAKTGTLRDTYALSGYSGRLAFALLLNNYPPDPAAGAPPPQADLDALAAMVAEASGAVGEP